MKSAQSRVQICDQRGHLLLREAAAEAGHHALSCQYIVPHGRIAGSRAAGQGFVVEDAMQIRRNLLQSQIVVLMAMGAARLIQMLAHGLLRGQRRSGMAAGKARRHSQADNCRAHCDQASLRQSRTYAF